MIIALACVMAIAVIAFILGVRANDLPEPEPESPFLHLDERKAAIYENLRDLQFEYRVGKLSDQDYQNTKRDLQKELASVLAEVDALKASLVGQVGQAVPPAHTLNGYVCASCGAKFDKPLKFCGECGKSMKVAQT
jgi:NADH pyrophosphatase NudC (nudix superfamily)